MWEKATKTHNSPMWVRVIVRFPVGKRCDCTCLDSFCAYITCPVPAAQVPALILGWLLLAFSVAPEKFGAATQYPNNL